MNIRRTICKIFPILTTATFLASCASHGNKFNAADVDKLRPGQSTIADAVTLLGKPTATSIQANGSTLLQWQFVQAVLLSARAAHLAILFDASDRMVRVTHRYESN